MGFWIGMFLTDLLIPVMMIVAGWMMWKHPPKRINSWYGYRTERSMKNEDTWKFAHDYCGRLWWKLGWILLIPSAIPLLFVLDSSEDAVGVVSVTVLVVQSVVMIAAILPTESALKNTFDKNGTKLRGVTDR